MERRWRLSGLTVHYEIWKDCLQDYKAGIVSARSDYFSKMINDSQRREEKQLRIIPLGKTGCGKSETGNTILNGKFFKAKCEPISVTKISASQTATVHGRSITYINTPGVFDTSLSDEELEKEIIISFIRCSPGPHAFLIILKVETYTAHEIEIVRKIRSLFGEGVLKYAVVLFTHGDNLDEDQTIEQFVSKNSELQQLVDKCGGPCHVIDNKYWNNKKKGYRSNKVQIKNLLSTISKMVEKNEGYRECYSNEMLQALGKYNEVRIQQLREELKGRSTEKIRAEAEEKTYRWAKSSQSHRGATEWLRAFLGSVYPCFGKHCSSVDQDYTPMLLKNE
ncbi:GTPase IMAP family member 3-like [Paramisgurnus dabryanus]|uniref:GTPase IMAP family member 3-like n=1 Tax=Paramisgurnus dabryanus TaxID=90735 RepID=UPI0031F46F0A